MPHVVQPSDPRTVCPDPQKGDKRQGVMGLVEFTGPIDRFWLTVTVTSPRGTIRQAWMHRAKWAQLGVPI